MSRSSSVTGSVEPPPHDELADSRPHAVPDAAAARLDQIKDLYVTAEAIGEDGLGKHFDQVSQRQRELIKEYFEQSKQNGAS